MSGGDYVYIEAVVCNVKDMPEKRPSMKEVDVGDAGKCLLIQHEGGDFSAVGHKCTHYGAPLVRGALSGGIVRCPWHGACFNAKTGDIEDFPGLDSLPKYRVIVDKNSGEVKVHARAKDLQEYKRNACLDSHVDTVGKDDSVVIIGGGPASIVCAETLRKEDFVGKVTIISTEPHPPYDRAKLSKAPDSDPSAISLRNPEYFETIQVDLRLSTEATSVDVDKKTLTIRQLDAKDDGADEVVTYDHLFVATGGKPRTLSPMQGWESENIYMLRTLHDGSKLAVASKDKRVVLVGSSFISMEIAAYMVKKGECKSVSVVCGTRSKVPFEASLGREVGGYVMKMHEDKGVVFHTAVGVKELVIHEETNMVKQLRLTDDSVIDVDIVVLGIGVLPATDFLKSTGIEMDDRGYVEVDAQMRTNIKGVYGGGDIVKFPLEMEHGKSTNIQHWQMAHAHGNIAARAIVDTYRTLIDRSRSKAVGSVPFFWTVQYGISIRYAGHGGKFDRVIIKGISKQGQILSAEQAMADKKFVAFYIREEHVVAVATMMSDPMAAQFAQVVKHHGVFREISIDKFMRGEMETKNSRDCTLS